MGERFPQRKWSEQGLRGRAAPPGDGELGPHRQLCTPGPPPPPQDELKKLYAQLEVHKTKEMAANNPHLRKKQGSWRQALGRSFMKYTWPSSPRP